MNHASNVVLICDSPEKSEPGFDYVIFWSAFYESNAVFSVPRYIEENSERLKDEYLTFLYDLGRKEIKGKPIIEHLLVRDDFSIWWMSLLIEKSQWKSPQIYDIFRLMALENIVRELDVQKIVVSLADDTVQKALNEYAESAGMEISIRDIGYKKRSYTLKNIYKSFPHIVQAFIYIFRYILMRWPLRTSIPSKPKTENSIGFFSYFFNLDMTAAKDGVFGTRYWTALHQILSEKNLKSNWHHLYMQSAAITNAQQANKLVKKYNETEVNQTHYLLDSYLGYRVLGSTINDYLTLWFKSWLIGPVSHLFTMSDRKINLWSLMKEDWQCSIYGKTAILNCIFLNLFEKITQSMPKQKSGFYLLENQGWERALIYAWHKSEHGELIGVPHTAISEWDLRHFFTLREYENEGLQVLPLPDKVALNGVAALNAYRDNNFPNDRILKVEALRYLYLDEVSVVNNSAFNTSNISRVLVLGDYSPLVTKKQMQMLSDAVRLMNVDVELLVKAHPGCPIMKDDWPDISFTIVKDNLDNLQGEYDIAYTSNPTSAAVDVYLTGIPVIVMLDAETFNMSPLRGYSEVYFVATANELGKELNGKLTMAEELHKDFFFTDNKLSFWNDLLNIIE